MNQIQPLDEQEEVVPEVEPAQSFERFDRAQRIEHAVFLTAFTVLAVTGLAQMFATSPLGGFILGLMGGIEAARLIHRFAATVMMAEAIYHLLSLGYRAFVRRVRWSMLPTWRDVRDVVDHVMFYLGRRKQKPRFGRYSYVEKAEYFALVWGTIIMAVTGFMMWNPIATARVLPGEVIPAAKAAHGGEALLAVLAIVLWHFYHVHLRHFNLSMFTGRLSREEMEQEHPAELEAIERGLIPDSPTPEQVRRREVVFLPIAALIAVVLGIGLYQFITFEQTALITVPLGESAAAFSPQTPTPGPTFEPTETLEGVQLVSWRGRFEGLFRDRCGSCHGITSVGGLSLASYEEALEGGNTGPAVVPNDAEASQIIAVQSEGIHPGQLSSDELLEVMDWIESGAPES